MQNKGIFILVFIILLGVFVFVMFSPKAKDITSKKDNQNTAMENTTGQDPLVVEILKEGTGDSAISGDTVTVSYVGTLTDGTEFDKSIGRGDGTFSFKLGEGMVIRGWEEGILGMKIGEVRKLTISPEYAYGNRAIGNIPANSTLIFEVEMFKIQK